MNLFFNNKKKYQRLLNNLLDLRARDPTTFTRVNGISYFDLISKFGIEHAQKVLTQKNFQLNLKEHDLPKLLELVKKSDSPETIIKGYEKYKEKIFNTQKLMLKDTDMFLSTKKELLSKLQTKIQKTSTRWKQFRRKIIDMNTQGGVWPLYLATGFVSLKTTKKVIYAPFLLKKIDIKMISFSQIKIATLSEEWNFNEKLLFFLEQSGINIPEDFNFEQLTTQDILQKISQYFHIETDPNLFGQPFINKKKEEIISSSLNFCSGIVLGIFKPAGGHLRKTMCEIIKRGEVEEIINPSLYKVDYQKAISDYLLNSSENLIRIQPSNFSQDQATISALLHDTIIWGPPGTGKSQVIANIIANIFYQDKTALIISQKKAALDVLKKRLGAISPFAFFILNDNQKQAKEEFYQFLNQFLKLIENHSSSPKFLKIKTISIEETKALITLANAKQNHSYLASLKIIELFQTNKQLSKLFFKLSAKWEYPAFRFTKFIDDKSHDEQLKQYCQLFAQTNQISKERYFLFFKRYPTFIYQLGRTVYQLMIQLPNFDLNLHKNLIDQTSFAKIKKLLLVPKQLVNQKVYHSHEKSLVSFLAEKIDEKITSWRSNREKLKAYKKFASAIRARRRNLHNFVKDHHLIIRELFPIIITTPETSFINWEKNSVDYAILDETSQIFLEIGLPVLYLAKHKVLAGDREQLQPSRWFMQRDDWNDEEEIDLEENAQSVLDYVFEKGVYQVMLNKNYRSYHAALMSFSAKHFYDSQLDVADNLLKMKSQKAIEVVNLQDGQWEDNTNKIEAEKVLCLTTKNLQKYNKIIILTFNAKQRHYIEKKIFENYSALADVMEKEKLFIRNIENVQGDEADLVIISVVYDKNTRFKSTYVAKKDGKNALNVALSRAKEKMIVVKSFNAQKMPNYSGKDYQIFKQWISFLDMNAKLKKSYSQSEEIVVSERKTESDFETEVKEAIVSRLTFAQKVRLISQYPVGSKRIDIAILDKKNRYLLGIEVDGYYYHEKKGYQKYLEDYSRQEFLESKGYDLFRVKEIDWKLDKNTLLETIKKLVEKKLEI